MSLSGQLLVDPHHTVESENYFFKLKKSIALDNTHIKKL